MTTEREAITIVARVLKHGALGALNEFRPEAERIIDALRQADALRLTKAKSVKSLGRSPLTGKKVLKPASKPGQITLRQAQAAVRKTRRK